MTQPYAAPYRPPADPRYAAVLEPRPRPRTGRLGVVALVVAAVSLLAALPVALVAHDAGLAVARAHAEGFDGFAWVMLQPVRQLVLIGELSLWAGVALAVWGLAQGIVARRSDRGRGAATAAIAVAIASPFLVALGGLVAYAAGSAA